MFQDNALSSYALTCALLTRVTGLLGLADALRAQALDLEHLRVQRPVLADGVVVAHEKRGGPAPRCGCARPRARRPRPPRR